MTNLQTLIQKAETAPAELAMFLDRLSNDNLFFYHTNCPDCSDHDADCYSCPRGRIKALDWLNAEDSNDIQSLIEEYQKIQSMPPDD